MAAFTQSHHTYTSVHIRIHEVMLIRFFKMTKHRKRPGPWYHSRLASLPSSTGTSRSPDASTAAALEAGWTDHTCLQTHDQCLSVCSTPPFAAPLTHRSQSTAKEPGGFKQDSQQIPNHMLRANQSIARFLICCRHGLTLYHTLDRKIY